MSRSLLCFHVFVTVTWNGFWFRRLKHSEHPFFYVSVHLFSFNDVQKRSWRVTMIEEAKEALSDFCLWNTKETMHHQYRGEKNNLLERLFFCFVYRWFWLCWTFSGFLCLGVAGRGGCMGHEEFWGKRTVAATVTEETLPFAFRHRPPVHLWPSRASLTKTLGLEGKRGRKPQCLIRGLAFCLFSPVCQLSQLKALFEDFLQYLSW